MIFRGVHRAYRRAAGALESPKGYLPLSVVFGSIGADPTSRGPATRGGIFGFYQHRTTGRA